MPRKTSLLGAVFFVIALAVYSAGVSKAMLAPIASEEPVLTYAGQALNSRGTYDYLWECTQASAASPDPQTLRRFHFHPPAYVWLIAKLGKISGDYAFAARLIALVCVLSTAGLLLAQAAVLLEGHAHRWLWAWIAAALYLANPVAVKASAVLDSDASLFTLAFSVFTLAFLLYWRRKSGVLLGCAAGAWFLCLMSKLTMAVLIPPVLAVFLALRRKELSFKSVVWLVLAFGAAGGLFALVLQQIHFPFGELWSYLSRQWDRYAVQPSFTRFALKTFLSAAYTFLWMGPALLFLFLAAARKGGGDPLMDFVCLFSLVLVFGHMAIGGTYNRFPRFMTPGLPGLCLVAAVGAARVSESSPFPRAWPVLLFAGAAWYWLGVGDYLLTFVFEPRAAARDLLEADMRQVALKAGLQSLAYVLPFALLLWPARRPSWLLPMLLASFLGMDLAQARAGYDTYYDYGQTGAWRLVERANSLPGHRAIMAFPPLVYYRADAVSTYRFERDWYDDSRLLAAARDPRMQGIFFSAMDFPVSRAAHLRSRGMASALEREGYREERIGSYTAWIRRGER